MADNRGQPRVPLVPGCQPGCSKPIAPWTVCRAAMPLLPIATPSLPKGRPKAKVHPRPEAALAVPPEAGPSGPSRDTHAAAPREPPPKRSPAGLSAEAGAPKRPRPLPEGLRERYRLPPEAATAPGRDPLPHAAPGNGVEREFQRALPGGPAPPMEVPWISRRTSADAPSVQRPSKKAAPSRKKEARPPATVGFYHPSSGSSSSSASSSLGMAPPPAAAARQGASSGSVQLVHIRRQPSLTGAAGRHYLPGIDDWLRCMTGTCGNCKDCGRARSRSPRRPCLGGPDQAEPLAEPPARTPEKQPEEEPTDDTTVINLDDPPTPGADARGGGGRP